ncbi:methylamine utilization protein MauE [Streptomyces sp. NRRL B-1677]|uniref:MauE/DoxX family redox-associated membrane protein n=1 Tax=Streptomyces TaxID=1883 RepID=UPI001892B981|nr:MauE/DoxX family redox-associated membrane protein [Streptomyces sp. NRRL B-1677]MBF6049847.1 methylamine utilization protein MauE [Streptomyces sp. NRRL B-1677]
MGCLAIGIQCLIGVVFLASSAGKAAGRRSFDRFVSSVAGMQVVPVRRARPVARTVVAAEGAVCVSLAVPVPAATVVGLAIAAVLLAVFTAGIALSVRRGVRAPCRCFGASPTPLGPRHIVRNLALTAAAVTGAAAAGAGGTATPGGVAVAVLAGLLLGALVAALDDILDLFRPVEAQAQHPYGT